MSTLRSPSPTPPLAAPNGGPASSIPGRRRPRLTEGVAPASLVFSFLIGANLALGLILAIASLRGPGLEPRAMAALICACPITLSALGASLVRAMRTPTEAPLTHPVWSEADSAIWSRPTERGPTG
jgi:hypothetical protein